MEPSKKRRHSPLYPVLAAAALAGVFGSSCGAGLEEPIGRELQKIVHPADAGTPQQPQQPPPQQPKPPDFLGGGAPYEAFDFDAGTP